MKTIEVRIKARLGASKKKGWATIKAYVVTPELVVHHTVVDYLTNDDNPLVYSKSWTITHVPTGLAVAHRLRTRQKAIELISEIKDLANWNRVSKGRRLKNSKTIRAMILLFESDSIC